MQPGLLSMCAGDFLEVRLIYSRLDSSFFIHCKEAADVMAVCVGS